MVLRGVYSSEDTGRSGKAFWIRCEGRKSKPKSDPAT